MATIMSAVPAPDAALPDLCTCGRPAITYLGVGPDGERTGPWCGTNNLPPLPGSKQAMEHEEQAKRDEAWRADEARANAALAGIMLAVARIQRMGDLAEYVADLERAADDLKEIADDRPEQP